MEISPAKISENTINNGEGQNGKRASKLRKLLLENEENTEEKGENLETMNDHSETAKKGKEATEDSEIQREKSEITGDVEKESKEKLTFIGESEKEMEERGEREEKSNEHEIKERLTEHGNGNETENFHLDNEIEDDSDDDKLHIVENEDEIVHSPKTGHRSKHPQGEQCPFDCCKLGLNHRLAKMNDKENHDAFKRAHEIKYSVLLRAGHPELLDSSVEFDDFWRNFPSEDGLDEGVIMKELRTIEQVNSAVKPIVQIENGSHIDLNAFGAAGGESSTKEDKEKPDLEKSEASNRKDLANEKSEEERLRMKRLSACTGTTTSQRLPPKKRDRLYRPWMDLSCQTGGGINLGNAARDSPTGVIDLSKHQSSSTSINREEEGRKCSPDIKATLLERYDHITAMENGNLVYMCKTCFTTLKSEDEIKAHLYCQGVTKSVHCYLCRQDFTKEHYRHHLEHHDAHPAALKCKQCGIMFDNFAAKSNHQKTVHRTTDQQRDKEMPIGNKDVPYICYLCGQDFNFNSKAALSHTMTHVNGYPFPCDFCNNWFKGIETAVTRFVLRRNGGNMFLCSVDPFLYMGLFSNNRTH